MERIEIIKALLPVRDRLEEIARSCGGASYEDIRDAIGSLNACIGWNQFGDPRDCEAAGIHLESREEGDYCSFCGHRDANVEHSEGMGDYE